MLKIKFNKILIVLLTVILMAFSFISLVQARSSAEIQAEIDAQNATLNKTKQDLEKAQQDLNAKVTDLNGAQGELATILAEIEKLSAEKKYNETLLEIVISEQKLKELEKEERLTRQSLSLRNSYMDWRTNNPIANSIAKTQYDFNKTEQYNATVLKDDNIDINLIIDDLRDLDGQISDYQEQLKKLEQINADLESKKKELEARVAYLNSLAASTYGQVNSLRSSMTNIQGGINLLSEEQRRAILKEEEILRQNQGTLGNTNCLKDPNAPIGTIYFCGNGRDLYQGHGVGMSQYGAKGAADQGWVADSILQFYYPGAQVVQYQLSAEITVKYCQGKPALAAYQDNCMYDATNDNVYNPTYWGPIITERVAFDTYLAGLGEMPESWPLEARKAQIIAARTYAAKYTANGNPNYPICLTVYCQVSYFKDGDQGESSVVQQTKDKVITYGGSLIEALYSADNNQGNGNADIDTRFQQPNGEPNAGNSLLDKPYLRSINDNQFAQTSNNGWGIWKWKTFSYTMSDINNYLDFAGYSVWETSVGGVKSLSFERDPSLRVKRVHFYGNNGGELVMGGWWFKNYWISWVAARGTYDYIYSQTFYLNSN